MYYFTKSTIKKLKLNSAGCHGNRLNITCLLTGLSIYIYKAKVLFWVCLEGDLVSSQQHAR